MSRSVRQLFEFIAFTGALFYRMKGGMMSGSD